MRPLHFACFHSGVVGDRKFTVEQRNDDESSERHLQCAHLVPHSLYSCSRKIAAAAVQSIHLLETLLKIFKKCTALMSMVAIGLINFGLNIFLFSIQTSNASGFKVLLLIAPCFYSNCSGSWFCYNYCSLEIFEIFKAISKSASYLHSKTKNRECQPHWILRPGFLMPRLLWLVAASAAPS